MRIKKLAAVLALISIGSSLAFGQPTINAPKSTDDSAPLKKEAVVFLRETMADVNNLRTLENRISFSAELASLMWFHDPKEARSLYVAAFGNFKELLIQYDQRMNAFGESDEGEDVSYRAGMFTDLTDKAKVARRFKVAMQVRQQMAISLAEHDPELAFSFYFESIAAISNPEFRRQMESRDEFFETQLLTQIAQTNAEKATQFAVKSVERGLNYQHVELLKKLYEKNPEKGIEFAGAILGNIKSGKLDNDKFWVISSFLSVAGDSFENSRSEGGKKPMLGQSELRDLTDAFAQAILDNQEQGVNGLQYLSEIEKYNPARAVQIRAKFRKELSAMGASNVGAQRNSNTTTTSHPNVANTSSNSNTNSRAERERLERERSEKELTDNVEKLGNKQLPKEEREKIAAHARRILLQTPGKDKKIVGLSSLASQVARAGDKELASEIMKEARALVNPTPTNYQDFLLTWMLASGYAEAEPEKAFPLLEDTILRANDTLSAFIKVGEFIDVAEEMIDEGEVQVGAFGGQMVRGLTTELGMADQTLRTLAKADFKKTKDLTNRFDRAEVRILAKMMILRAILGEGSQAKKEGDVSRDK